MTRQLRQGDYLFIKVDSMPESFSQRDKTGIVGFGEKTGHMHQISGDATLYRDGSSQQQLAYIQVEKPSEIVHNEHKSISLTEGIYMVKRQREFDGRTTRYVSD